MKIILIALALALGLSIQVNAQTNEIKTQDTQIVHTVLFRFIPGTSGAQINKLTSGLILLKGILPGIEKMSYGENFSARSQGFTYAVTITFSDSNALKAFYVNPEHQNVIRDLILPIKADMIVVDYEDRNKK